MIIACLWPCRSFAKNKSGIQTLLGSFRVKYLMVALKRERERERGKRVRSLIATLNTSSIIFYLNLKTVSERLGACWSKILQTTFHSCHVDRFLHLSVLSSLNFDSYWFSPVSVLELLMIHHIVDLNGTEEHWTAIHAFTSTEILCAMSPISFEIVHWRNSIGYNNKASPKCELVAGGFVKSKTCSVLLHLPTLQLKTDSEY